MLPRVNMVRGEGADYLLFSVRDCITEAIQLHGSWEQHMPIISRQFLDGVEAPLVLDIGANLGGYSIPIAKAIAAQSGKIFAFEPQRIVYYQLCGNLFLNRLDNVYAFNIAIGEEDGNIELPDIDYARSHNIGSFSLNEEIRSVWTGVSLNEAAAGNRVKISRLDSIEVPKSPALIKVDVEGLELSVLRGGRTFLANHGFPPMLLEAWKAEWFSERRAALLAFLEDDLGYETFQFGEEIVAQHPEHSRYVRLFMDAAQTLVMERVR